MRARVYVLVVGFDLILIYALWLMRMTRIIEFGEYWDSIQICVVRFYTFTIRYIGPIL